MKSSISNFFGRRRLLLTAGSGVFIATGILAVVVDSSIAFLMSPSTKYPEFESETPSTSRRK